MRTSLWAIAVASLMGLGTAWADTPGTQPSTSDPSHISGTQTTRQLTPGEMIFRASTLQGMNVYNANNTNEKLGDIKDIVIDVHHGKIQYGVLSGEGKYFAVPWDSLRLARGSNNKNYLMLNVAKDELRNAPGFPSNDWPDFADPQFVSKVHQFYGTRTATRPSSER